MCFTTCITLPPQDSLASKVNVDDLASLMPQGSGADEAATTSLMSKLLEIQNRLAQLEGEMNYSTSQIIYVVKNGPKSSMHVR